jgi:hypothetical protein
MKWDWNMMEAIGAVVAAIMAIWAFSESLRMRKNSAFNTLFAQLIANHKELFADKELSAGFYSFFHKRLDDVRTMRDLVDSWNAYKGTLDDKRSVCFSHAFKYVYHEVVTVLSDGTINEKAKRHYLGIIQSCMNKDELFCYLVNLLQHFETYPDAEDYRVQLKRYHFFDDLMRAKDERYKDVMKGLCTQLYMDVGKLVNL